MFTLSESDSLVSTYLHTYWLLIYIHIYIRTTYLSSFYDWPITTPLIILRLNAPTKETAIELSRNLQNKRRKARQTKTIAYNIPNLHLPTSLALPSSSVCLSLSIYIYTQKFFQKISSPAGLSISFSFSLSLYLSLYIYIYICVCVCGCACVYACACKIEFECIHVHTYRYKSNGREYGKLD